MIMFTDIIQVEIVRPWWDDTLPLIAIVLSLGTLFWTVWDRNRGRARLKIQERGYTHGPDGTGHYLHVAVRNTGRIDSTAVSSVTLFLAVTRWKNSAGMIMPPLKTGQEMPVRLQAGDAIDLYFDVDTIRQELSYFPDLRSKLERLSAARIEVEAGHEDISQRLSKWARRYLAGDNRMTLLERLHRRRRYLFDQAEKLWRKVFRP